MNSVITEISAMWDGLKIVHGKPRHSQSQGSVERANRDIEDMLMTWLQSNSTTHWGDGLRFIQVMKNRAYHEGIKCSPYEAMFGQPMKVVSGIIYRVGKTILPKTIKKLRVIVKHPVKKEVYARVFVFGFEQVSDYL